LLGEKQSAENITYITACKNSIIKDVCMNSAEKKLKKLVTGLPLHLNREPGHL
jgi:hypothetical protein